MTALLRTTSATRTFGSFVAVDDVTMAVEPGEVVGLLGANGAGKTTLIRMVLGLLAHTAGEVELLGGPPDRERRRRMGYVPQGLGLYDDLTVAENLSFSSQAYGVVAADAARRPRRARRRARAFTVPRPAAPAGLRRRPRAPARCPGAR